MIRFIFVVLFLGLYLVLGIPVLGVEWLIGKFNKKACDYQSLRMVQWAFKVILKISGVHVTVIGEENIPDEPVLFILVFRSEDENVVTFCLLIPAAKGSPDILPRRRCLSIPCCGTG